MAETSASHTDPVKNETKDREVIDVSPNENNDDNKENLEVQKECVEEKTDQSIEPVSQNDKPSTSGEKCEEKVENVESLGSPVDNDQIKVNDEVKQDDKPVIINGEVNDKEENQKDNIDDSNSNNITQDEWARREKALLEKIASFQKQQDDNSISGIKLQLKVKCEENEILKAKLINLQTELSAVMKKPNAKNKDIVSKIKKQHEELLTKAKGMIFDKTKVIKNQELQIEALTAQVKSLKEVASITKDLLGIRNLEVSHLQERLEVMDMKIQAERDRYNLMTKKVESGTKLNEELKKEYTTQLVLFKELKERYEEKFVKMQEELDANKSNDADPGGSQ